MMLSLNPKRKKIVLLNLLAILFIAPVIIAWILFHFHPFQFKSTAHGKLISPPIILSQLVNTKPLKKTWLLIYIAPTKCETTCLKNIYFMRQIHTALGKNQNRLPV